MWVHCGQVKVVALCASLLAVVASALVGCGTTICTAAIAPPPHVVLTVENGVVYGVTDKRFAIRARDGKVLWQNAENPYVGPHGLNTGVYRTGAAVAPVVDGQTVIETMGIGLFMALQATDGKMLWHSQLLTGLATSTYGALDHPPVVADGVIYAAAGYGTIGAWDERDGHTLWVSHFAPDAEAARPTTNSTYSAGLPLPVVAGSTLYASAGRSVYALRVSDGSVLWHLPDAPVSTSYSVPVVAANNTVYVADADATVDTVFALDSATGAIRWHSSGRTSTVVGTRSRVVVQGQTVFVASQGGLVRALNAATGAQLWRYQTRIGAPLASLVVEGGRIYLTQLAWGLYVLDAATGRELWDTPLDQGIFNSTGLLPDRSMPVVDQGMVVILVAANGVEAWRVSDGKELWVAHIPDEEDPALVESAAVAAGMVYVAQRGQTSCFDNGKQPRVLALRDTDGTKRWQDSI